MKTRLLGLSLVACLGYRSVCADVYEQRLTRIFAEMERRGDSANIPVGPGSRDPREIRFEVRMHLLVGEARLREVSPSLINRIYAIQIDISSEALYDVKTRGQVMAINDPPSTSFPGGRIKISLPLWSKTDYVDREVIIWHEYLGLQERDRKYEISGATHPDNPDSFEIGSQALLFGSLFASNDLPNSLREQTCHVELMSKISAVIRAGLGLEGKHQESVAFVHRLLTALRKTESIAYGYKFDIVTYEFQKFRSPLEAIRALGPALQPQELAPGTPIETRKVEELFQHYYEVKLIPYNIDCPWTIKRK